MHPLMSEAEVRERQLRLGAEASRGRIAGQARLRLPEGRRLTRRRHEFLRTWKSRFGQGFVLLCPRAVLAALRLRGNPTRVRIGAETRE